jgi:hypothetical protein
MMLPPPLANRPDRQMFFYDQAQQLESRTFISSTNASSEVTNEGSGLLNASTRNGKCMFYFYMIWVFHGESMWTFFGDGGA